MEKFPNDALNFIVQQWSLVQSETGDVPFELRAPQSDMIWTRVHCGTFILRIAHVHFCFVDIKDDLGIGNDSKRQHEPLVVRKVDVFGQKMEPFHTIRTIMPEYKSVTDQIDFYRVPLQDVAELMFLIFQ